MSVHDDRLRAEFEAMKRFRSQVVTWKTLNGNNPPDDYLLTYNLRSLIDFNDSGLPIFHVGFSVTVHFPPDYPRSKPEVRLYNKPWPKHPNIYPRDGRFCLEGNQNWIPGIGVPLDSLCLMVGEVIAFQHVNLRSPANGHSTLSKWITENLRFEGNTRVTNPVDSSPVRLPDVEDAIRWGDDRPAGKPRIRF